MVETIYDPFTRTARFAVKEPGKEPYCAETLRDSAGRILVPLVDDMVHHGVVLLPSEIGPPLPPPRVFAEVVSFLHRHVGFAHRLGIVIASLYVLLTWRFDEFTAVPYLRVIGPPGSGKRRTLKTIASIGYRAINVPGGGSQKAMLRLLDRFRGTAIIYYADIRGRSQKERETAIRLALGSESDLFDTALKPGRWSEPWEPTARNLFGPKVLATLEPFRDPLLESLCLTLNLQPTMRTDIAISLPPFLEWKEAMELRNMLLRYRLDHAKDYPGHQSPTFDQGISPNLQKLVMPLKKVAEDFPDLLLLIDEFATHYDPPRRAPDRLGKEIIVLQAITMRLGDGPGHIAIQILADELTRQGTSMTPTRLGKMLRSLGVLTKRSTGGYTVIATNPEEIIAAYRGLGITPPTCLLAQGEHL